MTLAPDRFSSFWRVTLPLCRPDDRRRRAADLPADARRLLHQRPALGVAEDLDGRQPDQRQRARRPGQTGQAGAFVMLVFLVALLPMLYYVRATSRADRGGDVRSPGRAGGTTRGGRRGSWSASPSATGVVAAAGADRGAVSRSTTAGPARRGRASRSAGTGATRLLSVWHDDALHTALLQTLKLGRDRDPDHRSARARCSRSASTAGAAGCPSGRTSLMLLSFVLPEVLLAVALLFVITTVAVPVDLGTTAQVIGLVTFQVSYPAVLVRARLATIGPQYEEAAMDLGASPLGALRRVIAADADARDLRQHRAGVRRRHRRLRAGALPVRRRRPPNRCR